MNTVDLHISYLLSRHDCVIVEGLGAFVAQYMPARIDYTSGRILPPGRVVGFNASLKHNDGVLACSLSRGEGITYDEASRLVAQWVGAMRGQLSTVGTAIIANLGSLKRQESGELEFVPMATPLVSPRYFGLEPVEIVSVKDAVANGERSRSRTVRALRTGIGIAASIAVLVGVGLLANSPLAGGSQADEASVSPVVEVKTARNVTDKASRQRYVIIKPVDGRAVVDTTSHNLYRRQMEQIAQWQEMQRQAAEAQAVTPQQASPSTGRRFVETDPYCLVVGTLPNYAEAQRFIAATGDNDLHIVAAKGRYQVCAASGATYEAVVAAQTELAEKYRGSWVAGMR